MNQTHIHLLITHLPIFGSILGAFVLIQGIWAKNNQIIISAYTLIIISSIGAIVAYLTGEAAEETIEHIMGVSESAIEQHEDFAKVTFIAFIISGIISLLGIYVTAKKLSLSRIIAIIILFSSLICFGLAARTGFLGGKIRHTEINSDSNAPQQQETENEEED